MSWKEEYPKFYIEFMAEDGHQAIIQMPDEVITEAIGNFVQKAIDNDDLLRGGTWRLISDDEAEQWERDLDDKANLYDDEYQYANEDWNWNS
jgi:hypothetical protein